MSETKRCARCKEDKPVEEFPIRSGTGWRHSWCRPCKREYDRAAYKTNTGQGSDRATNRTKAAEASRDRCREFLWDYLLQHPCVDCGEADPVVLEFDHLPEHCKKATVSSMTSYGIESVRSEIAKCEVVCSNCHSRRTFTRSDSWRYKTMRV